MKKAIFFSTVITVSVLLLFAGCKKKEEPGTPGSVTTIKGQAKAELNLTMTGYENIPDGTKITFLVDPNDLLNNPDTTKKYDSYRYTATVVSGVYSVNVPARNDGSKVKIVADEFDANFVIDNNNSTRVVYSAPVASITVYAGTTTIYDVNY